MNNRPHNNRGGQNNNPGLAQRVTKAKQRLPYGFIPVKDKDPELVDAADLGSLDPNLYTGYINCSLHALNELCVGNTHVDLGNDLTEIQPLEVGGKIIISADTLRGCVSNFLAAYLGLPISRLNERRYSFRPNNVPSGSAILSGAGIVESINNGVYKIKKFTENTFAFVPHNGNPQNKYRGLKNGITWTKHIYSNKAKDYVDAHKYIIDDNIDSRTPKKYIHTGSFMFYGYHDGIDGKGNLGLNTQHPVSHKAFGVRTNGPRVPPEFESQTYLVSTGTVKNYKETQSEVLANDTTGHFTDHPMADRIKGIKDKILNNIRAEYEIKKGDLVFFEYKSDSNEVLTFGKHFRYRWAYSRSLRGFKKDYQEYNQNALSSGKVNLIEEMFGYSYENKDIPYEHRSKSGKVHFSYAVHQEDSGGLKVDKWLPRPGSPKPSSYEFYLRQNGSEPMVTYGDPARPEYTKNPPRLSGRKMYYKTKTTPYNDNKQENGVDKTVKLVKVLYPTKNSYPTFTFRVSYENLTAKELKLLYFALCLGQNTPPDKVKPDQIKDLLCHQIGYGKNNGMGAVKITVDRKNGRDEMYAVKTDVKTGALQLVFLSFEKYPAISDNLRQLLLVHDKPRSYPADKNGEIYSWHTRLKNDDLKKRRS